MFFASKQNSTSTGSDGPSRPSNKLPPQPRIFGVGSRGVFGVGMRSRAPKVSRKTSLPMVVGSPVKGGERDTRKDDVDDDDDSLEIVMDTRPDTSSLGEDEYFVPITGDSPKETGKKGKDKDDDGLQDKSSGRASLASLGLSASLNALPPKGSMGPPPIPKPRRITRSVSSGNTSTSQAKPLEIEEDDKSNTKSKSKAKGSSSIDSPLKFLKDCVAYVDVRTDDGDDAGSLFVEMLESAGAKLLTRVGQTCTHIIFKNGLLSTMSRYRLLRDPKPHVVGIAWVVECVEQRKHVDEGSFLIDLSEINVAGVNKRRKSLLPKLVAEELDGIVSQESDHGTEDGDRSMDGSNSSLILDDLPPLERARRRKSFLFGSRH
ncbi:hypothetical protein F5887DRAFT_144631 [Amanita rubescens]|nr:hypothetical protein F5887DRAFT_144631 [Amanita rubescens]